MKKLNMIKSFVAVLGVFIFSNAQAQCLSIDDFLGEGIPYKCEEEKVKIVTAKLDDCVDQQSFSTEGIPHPCEKGSKTKVTNQWLSDVYACYCEGMPERATASMEIIAAKKKVLKTKPAAGSTK